jgi:hypothetical protein
VVVGDLYFIGIAIPPNEAKTPLIVDANAELSSAVTSQPFEPVPWKRRENLQIIGSVEHIEFAKGGPLKRPKLAARLTADEPLGVGRAKGLNHRTMVYCSTLHVKE